MINRNNKKGFTIVELVIVIAVIVVLAAVLIPTFASIIKKADTSFAYRDYYSDKTNKKSDKAEICSFNIVVNGKAIDNKKEEYPLLVYRDVTYFPLTWRFAVDEFGWNYSYSKVDGVSIDSFLT